MKKVKGILHKPSSYSFLHIFLVLSLGSNVLYSANFETVVDIMPLVTVSTEDQIRSRSTECALASLSAEVQAALDVLNNILTNTMSIQNIINIISQQISNNSFQESLILSALDTIDSNNSAQESLILSALDMPCAAIPITTSTILTLPGFYCLANDVATIDIFNTDIVLDLNGHVVTNGLTSHSHNITVRNGTVRRDFTGSAINVSDGSNITISNVRVESSFFGIDFVNVDGGLIENCEIVDNAIGIELFLSSNVTVEHCMAFKNLERGFDVINSFTNTIRSCQALNTGEGVLSSSVPVAGFRMENSSGNVVENCIANETQQLFATDITIEAAGFLMTRNSSCNKIINCEASNSVTNASGFSIPYGILLQSQFDGLIATTALTTSGSNLPDVFSIAWSPDGNYLAVAIDVEAVGVSVYRFDRMTNTLILVARIIQNFLAITVRSLAWSPDGKYLVTGDNTGKVTVYQFTVNPYGLVFVDDELPGHTGSIVKAVSWMANGDYIAVGVDDLGDGLIVVLQFNRTLERLNAIGINFSPDGSSASVLTVAWSPDGSYLAAGDIDDTFPFAGRIFIYRFTPSPFPLAGFVQVGSAVRPGGDSREVRSVAWSPNGTYLAFADRAGTGIIPFTGRLGIYLFDRAAGTLAQVGPLVIPDTSFIMYGVAWSANGRYIVGGGVGGTPTSSGIVYAYDFDPAVGLTAIGTPASPTGPTTTYSVSWSPDGQYIAVGSGPSGQVIVIVNALTFPFHNVITNNTVYCNASGNGSGVGISGSSICNYIVGNTAYSNPINPLNVPSNYQFVCNVFNQLFGNIPSLMQNIALGGCEPIAIPDNTALLGQQTLARMGGFKQGGADLGAAPQPASVINASTKGYNIIQLLKTILIKLYYT